MRSGAVTAAAFFLCGGILASFVSLYSVDHRLYRVEALCSEESVDIKGAVNEVVWDGGYKGIYVVSVESAKDLSDFQCLLTSEGGIGEGAIIEATAKFSPLSDDTQFNERQYYLSKNVLIKAESEEVRITGEVSASVTSLAKDLNDRLSETLITYLGNDAGGFASALLLGNKPNLDDTVKRDFSRLGISHVLAVSGMHLAIMCAFVSLLLSPLGRKASLSGSAVTVVFYMLLTGFSPSVTRSGIMLLFMIFASFLGRSNDRFTTLGLSVFLICITDPFSCTDIGLQLSFTCIMAILLFTDKRREPIQVRTEKSNLFFRICSRTFSAIKSGGSITVVILLFILPLQWLYFGEISLVSPLTSPIFSIISTLILWALPILLLLSPSPTIATIFAIPLEKLIEFVISFANKLSGLRNITFSLNFPFAPVFCILIFISVIIFCVAKGKKRVLSLILVIAVISTFAVTSLIYCRGFNSKTVVSSLSHKSNDGIFLQSENRCMLIDMSNGYSGIFDECIEELENSHLTEIETIMLTHSHKTYVSTLDSLFSDHMVRRLLLPNDEKDYFSNLEDVAKKHKVEVEYYTPGDSIEFYSATVVTHENLYIKRSVQPIVRIDIQSFGKSFTYLGSAYLESFPVTELSCDYIVFGGHGPLYKSEFEPILPENCRVIASEASKEYFSPDHYISAPDTIIMEN